MKKQLRKRQARFGGMSIGLDLHKDFIQYSVLDEAGDEVAADRIGSRAEALEGLIETLSEDGRRLQVSFEASGCFLWVYDLLIEKLGRDQVHVAAPSKVRVIADSMEKNDENDAWWLGYLMYEGRLPEAFVAEGDLRELRIAAREHRAVIDERSDLMRRLRSHCTQLGVKFPENSWTSHEGRARITSVVDHIESNHGVRGKAAGRLWTRIQSMDEEVDHWESQLARLSERFKEVEMLNRELPGVGRAGLQT